MIASRLYRRRLEKGLAQSELARLSGIPQPAIAAFECGRQRPGLTRLLRLEKALGLPQGGLLYDSPEPRELNRFTIEKLCRSLIENRPKDSPIKKSLWKDLVASFYTRLRLLAPAVQRRHPRIRPTPAKRRLNALFGKKNFQVVDRRLAKIHPIAS